MTTHTWIAVGLAFAGATAAYNGSLNRLTLDAARDGKVAQLHVLLTVGANPNTSDLDGWTPLLLSIRAGQSDSAQELIRRGASVNARLPVNGTTPLMWAAARGDEKLVSALLAAGADASATDARGRTAEQFATGRARTALRSRPERSASRGA